MATTRLPEYDGPITISAEKIREHARNMLASASGDCDKAGVVEDAVYYQGRAEALHDLLVTMLFPQTEDQALTCKHGNRFWFGHECGLCEGEGYDWMEVRA